MGHYVGNATYQCLHCRLAQRAEVRTIMLPSRRARGAGRGDANSALAVMLALKRCPRCGHYDRGVADHHRQTIRVALIAYTILLALVAVTLLAIPAVPREAVAATLGVFVIGFVLILWRLRRRFPVNVESYVSLVGPTAREQSWF